MTTPEPLRRAVSPLELLFDVVYVFAVSQLAHHLLEDLSWRGAAQTLVLVIAVFGVWAVVSFVATLLDIALPRTKAVIVAVMGLGLFMNAGLANAFGDRPWAFVGPFLVIMLGHGVVSSVVAPSDVLRGHFRRALVWALVATPLWLVGALVDPAPRLWWWAAAAAVEIVGFWLAHPLPGRVLRSEHLEFDADHMRERLRLFVIIALGETVLTVGPVVAGTPPGVPTVAATAGVLVALVCLWGTYFGGGEGLFAEHVAGSSDPIRSVRLAMNVTYAGVAGLVAVAVGSELVIAHPLGHGSATFALVLFGGVALYLAAQVWYFRAVIGDAWAPRLVALVAVAAVGVGAVWLPPLVSLVVLDAVLIGLVARLVRVQPRVHAP